MSDQVATLRELYRQWPRRRRSTSRVCAERGKHPKTAVLAVFAAGVALDHQCPNLVDERWIIIAATALVDADAPGHGPHAKAVLGGRPQKLGAGHADQEGSKSSLSRITGMQW